MANNGNRNPDQKQNPSQPNKPQTQGDQGLDINKTKRDQDMPRKDANR